MSELHKQAIAHLYEAAKCMDRMLLPTVSPDEPPTSLLRRLDRNIEVLGEGIRRHELSGGDIAQG
jgi:hypothetical protein